MQGYCGYARRCVVCGGTHLPRECFIFALSRQTSPSVSSLVGWLVDSQLVFLFTRLMKHVSALNTEARESPKRKNTIFCYLDSDPQKLPLTSPTGGGHSVGMVRSRTKATEFSLDSEDPTLLAWNVRVQLF